MVGPEVEERVGISTVSGRIIDMGIGIALCDVAANGRPLDTLANDRSSAMVETGREDG